MARVNIGSNRCFQEIKWQSRGIPHPPGVLKRKVKLEYPHLRNALPSTWKALRNLRLPARTTKTWPSGESRRRDWLRLVPSPLEGRFSFPVTAQWMSNCLGLRGMVRAAASTACFRRPPSHEKPPSRLTKSHERPTDIAITLTFREAHAVGVFVPCVGRFS